jgi:hypothetical protein
VRTFSCFITDDRYSVPTLAFLIAADEQRARELAVRQLFESPHHIEVEIREGGRFLYARGRASGAGEPGSPKGSSGARRQA